MAKKDPTDLTVEEKLKALYQLQVTLSGIDENRELRGELPLEVQDLEDDIAGLTTRIENIQREIEQFDHAVYQKQNEIADAQASLERYHAQLDTVSNNREYDTLRSSSRSWKSSFATRRSARAWLRCASASSTSTRLRRRRLTWSTDW